MGRTWIAIWILVRIKVTQVGTCKQGLLYSDNFLQATALYSDNLLQATALYSDNLLQATAASIVSYT